MGEPLERLGGVIRLCNDDGHAGAFYAHVVEDRVARRLTTADWTVAGASVESNTLWGGRCSLFDNGPRLLVADSPRSRTPIG